MRCCSRFREAYGEAALQLFRDRARDEKGFFSRVGLWFDVLTDLAISVPREYHHIHGTLVAASARSRMEGVPSLFVLEDESPRPGALFLGGMLTLLALFGFSMGINRAGSYGKKLTMWSGEPASHATSSRPGIATPSPFESSWRSMLERLGRAAPAPAPPP